jgi:hypothetical protein
MGTSTRWDIRTQDDGAPAERFDAVRSERFAPGTTRAHDEGTEFVRRSLSRYYQ